MGDIIEVLRALGYHLTEEEAVKVLEWVSRKWEAQDLRDHFAGQALAGLLAREPTSTGPWLAGAASDFAEQSYAIADAMLSAREGK